VGIETELKLTFLQQICQICFSTRYLSNPSRRQKLLNTYFDTPELTLLKKGIAVRDVKSYVKRS
jgi:inorganic triphosphatase YgiF